MAGRDPGSASGAGVPRLPARSCSPTASLADAQRIAGWCWPKAPTMTAAQLRRRLNVWCCGMTRPPARNRSRQTIADRDVYLGDGGDGGTAGLTAFNLPVARAAAAFERVDAIARARRAGGDARTLAQLRADTVLDLLDGTGCEVGPQFRQGVLDLQIPLATAIGADAQPADLAGYGPVLADVARQIARDRGDLQWRFSVTYKGELVYQGITKTRPEPHHPAADTGDLAPAPATPAPARLTRASPTENDNRDRNDDHGGGDRGGGAWRRRRRRRRVAADDRVAHTTSDAALRRLPDRGADHRRQYPRPVPTGRDRPARRFPGRKLRMWITARDRTCQAPGCHAPGPDLPIRPHHRLRRRRLHLPRQPRPALRTPPPRKTRRLVAHLPNPTRHPDLGHPTRPRLPPTPHITAATSTTQGCRPTSAPDESCPTVTQLAILRPARFTIRCGEARPPHQGADRHGPSARWSAFR